MDGLRYVPCRPCQETEASSVGATRPDSMGSRWIGPAAAVTFAPVIRLRHLLQVLVLTGLAIGCHSLDRNNPVDPSATHNSDSGQPGAGLSLVVPLPKALATVVDSLVARLSGPDIPTVVKALDYPSPLGPATLTIGAVSPGSGRVLVIEGYDLTGRLILSGERRDITIVTGDTTRIAIDLRLAIDPSELDAPDTTAAVGDSTVSGDPPQDEGPDDGSGEVPTEDETTAPSDEGEEPPAEG